MSENLLKFTSENLHKCMYVSTIIQRIPSSSGGENWTKIRFSIKTPSAKLQKLKKNGLLPFYFVKQIDSVKVRS